MGKIQEALHDVFESGVRFLSKAGRRLRFIIERYPYAFDAYDRIAYAFYYLGGKLDEFIGLLTRGLERARELFSKDFILGESSLARRILENRPFLWM